MTHTVANTILAQLGGNRFIAMTGANTLVAGENRLTMKIGRNAGKITHFRVTLDVARDLYNLEFLKIRGINCKVAASHEGVYFDQMREIFTNETGLYTSL